MADDKISKDLSAQDQNIILGFQDPLKPEVETLPTPIKAVQEEKPEEKQQKLHSLKERADELLKRIEATKSIVDERCSYLKIATGEPVGSPLMQAMMRVFGEKTTTITYDHFKRAIALQKILLDEDTERLKKT